MTSPEEALVSTSPSAWGFPHGVSCAPPKVREQLTGTTHAMFGAVYDEVPFEEFAEAMEALFGMRKVSKGP
jgi:hypothetical protein